ncbi:hypothetical protein CLV51_1103 [Chitinophaga niastensis]|uniref:Uncharacterized protein n=1 Tax=Chitinophaga niastensis TaxID=536980 RepID=A0A2P8H977_CHINA|nr:hypothetical protein CLV51_1103 [Chitinophaga niastensis]
MKLEHPANVYIYSTFPYMIMAALVMMTVSYQNTPGLVFLRIELTL